MMTTKARLRLTPFVLFVLVCCFIVAEQAKRTSGHNAAAVHASALTNSETKQTGVYDVTSFGAKGDGKTLDTAAINKAIATAASNGGGTVRFPAGTYLSVSIRLKSNISLYIDQGATIVAAETSKSVAYDPPEPNQWDAYQDFGHSHWHNSLIWGENLENVSIVGPGLIWGKGCRQPARKHSRLPRTRNVRSDPGVRILYAACKGNHGDGCGSELHER